MQHNSRHVSNRVEQLRGVTNCVTTHLIVWLGWYVFVKRKNKLRDYHQWDTRDSFA